MSMRIVVQYILLPTMLSIPEIALQIVNSTKTNDETSNTSLFVMGSKAVGKSTLINSFLDKNDPPKETLVLDYSYGRKTNQKQSIEKHICHVWEYGGNLDTLKSVISSLPMSGKLVCAIILDLSKIRIMWSTLEICLSAVNEIKSKNADVELLIIGGKYDVFRNFESDTKKLICNTLRSVALLNISHLMFYSAKDPSLVRRAKDVLHGVTFGNGFPTKDKVTGINKPLFLQSGTDSWESIGVASPTIEQVKAKYLSLVPAEVEVPQPLDSRGPQSHPEPVLDSLIQSRLEELHHFPTISLPIT